MKDLMISRILVIIFELVLILNPLIVLGGSEVEVEGGGAKVEESRNGVLVVNIDKPSEGGVSVNNFRKFNVGEEGLIFNNSSKAGVSELGGAILGNANLGGGGAKIIVGQVIGGSSSELRGYMEIYGGRSDLILANRNGIICDGCGFINTGEVDLVVGDVEYEGGGIKGYKIGGGRIEIGLSGLNGDNIDKLDLITRGIDLRGRLRSKELNIYLGNEYYDKEREEVSSSEGLEEEVYEYAIDGGELGGMYAGSIKIIGTEEGLGVNTKGEMISYLTDANIDVRGVVVLNKVVSKGDLKIRTGGGIEIVEVESGGEIELLTEGEVEIKERVIGENLKIEGEDVEIGGELSLSDRLEIKGLDIKLGGLLLSKYGINIEGRGKIESRGRIESSYLKLGGLNYINKGELKLRDITLEIRGGDFINEGEIESNNFRLKGELLRNAGYMLVNDYLGLGVGGLINEGELLLNRSQKIAINELTNRGTLLAKGDLRLNLAGDMKNEGGYYVWGNLEIEGEDVRNEGELIGYKDNKYKLRGEVENGGLIGAGGGLNLEIGGDISNEGTLLSLKDLEIRGELLRNGGTIKTGGELGLRLESLRNAGLIGVNKQGKLELDGEIENRGNIELNGGGEIKVRNLANEGLIYSEDKLSLGLGGDLRNGGYIGAGSLRLDILGDLKNVKGGEIGVGDVEIKANNVTNEGSIKILSKGLLRIRGRVDLGGELRGNQVSINASKDLEVNGKVLASNLELRGSSLRNEGIIESRGGVIVIDVKGRLSNKEEIRSGGDLLIKSGILDNELGSKILAKENLVIQGDRINNKKNSLLFSLGDMRLLSKELLNYWGQIDSRGELLIGGGFNKAGGIKESEKVKNISGEIRSTGAMYIYTSYLLNKAEYKYKFVKSEQDFVMEECGSNGRKTRCHTFKYKEWEQEQDERYEASKISSLGNIALKSSKKVENEASIIRAKGTIEIEAKDFINKSYVIDKSRAVRDGMKYEGHHYSNDCPRFGSCKKKPIYVKNWIQEITRKGTLLAEVGAGGNIIIRANQIYTGVEEDYSLRKAVIKHSAIKEEFSNEEINQGISREELGISYKEEEVEGGLKKVRVIEIDLGRNQLARINEDIFKDSKPGHRYLIESDELLSSVDDLVGSEYFFNKVGFSAEDQLPLLGDAGYEQEIIKRQLEELTGEIDLEGKGLDINGLMKKLYENGADLSKGLDLRPGEHISKEELENLKKDVIWYEKEKVRLKDGRELEVLVPKLYLSKVSLEELKKGNEGGGAELKGEDVYLKTTGDLAERLNKEEEVEIELLKEELIKEELSWGEKKYMLGREVDKGSPRVIKELMKGNEIEKEELNIEEGLIKSQVLSTEEGSKQYKEKVEEILAELKEKAREDIIKHQGWKEEGLSKEQEGLIARKLEELVEKRYKKRAEGIVLEVLGKRGELRNGGKIRAKGKVYMASSGDINNIGGSIKSGGDMIMTAGRRLNIESTKYEVDQVDNVYGGIVDKSRVESGGDIIIRGGDINIRGAELEAKGDGDISGINVNIESIELRNKRTENSGAKTTITSSMENEKSEIKLGGDLRIRSKVDINIRGGDIVTGGRGSIEASGQVRNIGVQDVYTKEVITEKESGNDLGLGTDITITEKAIETKTKKNKLSFGKGGEIRGDKGILLTGIDIDTGKGDLVTESKEGGLRLANLIDVKASIKIKQGEGIVWNVDKGEMERNTIVVENEIKGRIKDKTAKGATLDIKKEKKSCISIKGCKYETDIEALERMFKQDKSKKWMLEAYKAGKLKVKGQQNKNEYESYDNSGLGAIPKVGIAIVVSMFVSDPSLASIITKSIVNLTNDLGRGNGLEIDTINRLVSETINPDNIIDAVLAYHLNNVAENYLNDLTSYKDLKELGITGGMPFIFSLLKPGETPDSKILKEKYNNFVNKIPDYCNYIQANISNLCKTS